MTQLPLITNRSATRSVNERSYPQESKDLSYTERFQMVSRVTNYEGMSEQQIWKEYEKLRQCLKKLNDSVLEEIEKRQVVLRKESPKKKTVNESIGVIEEEIKTVQEAIKLSTIQLNSLQGKLKYVSGLNTRQMEDEYLKLKSGLSNLKANIKSMKTKTFLLSRNLTKGPSMLEKLSQTTTQLHLIQRKVFRQKNNLLQSQQLISSCIQKLEQLSKVANSRQKQYQIFEQETKVSDNFRIYQQLCSARSEMSKYESPCKKNYFLKLKELQGLVGAIQQEDQKIKDVEANVLRMKKEIETADGKTLFLRKQLKRQQGRFNSALETRDFELRQTNDKNLEDKCF